MRTTTTNKMAISVGKSAIKGKAIEVGKGRAEFGGGLGETSGVDWGNSMLVSDMLNGARTGYLSTASTK
jgi:hypothetical protein